MLLLVSKFLQEATSPEADEALAKPRRIHDGSFSSRFGTFRKFGCLKLILESLQQGSYYLGYYLGSPISPFMEGVHTAEGSYQLFRNLGVCGDLNWSKPDNDTGTMPGLSSISRIMF